MSIFSCCMVDRKAQENVKDKNKNEKTVPW